MPRFWFPNIISTKKELGLPGEIVDFRAWAGKAQSDPRMIRMPKSKKYSKNVRDGIGGHKWKLNNIKLLTLTTRNYFNDKILKNKRLPGAMKYIYNVFFLA